MEEGGCKSRIYGSTLHFGPEFRCCCDDGPEDAPGKRSKGVRNTAGGGVREATGDPAEEEEP